MLALLALWFSRYWYGEIISPLSVFVGINSISLAFYHLNLLDMYDVSFLTQSVVLCGLAAFVVGILVPSGIPYQRSTKALSHKVVTRGLGTFFYVTGLISTIGWVMPLRLLMQKYSADYLYQNLWILQDEFQMQFIGYLNLFGVLILPTFVIKWLLRDKRFVDLVLVCSALFGLLLAGIKSYFLISITTTILAFAVVRPGRIRIHHVAIMTVLVLGFFVLYDRIIDIFVADSFQDTSFPAWMNFLQRPYIYLVGSWPSLEQIVRGDMVSQVVWGQVTLQPIWKILGDGLGLVEPIPAFLPFVDIGVSNFNVFSFIGEVYWDYGLLGVIIMSFSMGFWVTWLYLRTRYHPSWVNILLYTLFAYGLSISFFAYYFQLKLILLSFYVLFFGMIVKKKLLPTLHTLRKYDTC